MFDEFDDEDGVPFVPVRPFQAHIIFWIDGVQVVKVVAVSATTDASMIDDPAARAEMIDQMTNVFEQAIADKKAMESVSQ